jgi:hypothetical protein
LSDHDDGGKEGVFDWEDLKFKADWAMYHQDYHRCIQYSAIAFARDDFLSGQQRRKDWLDLAIRAHGHLGNHAEALALLPQRVMHALID